MIINSSCDKSCLANLCWNLGWGITTWKITVIATKRLPYNLAIQLLISWAITLRLHKYNYDSQCINYIYCIGMCRAQWLRGRASDSRLRGPGLESCAAVLKLWASCFTLLCSSSLSCINEYLAIDSGGYVYEQPSRIDCSIWLDPSQRS